MKRMKTTDLTEKGHIEKVGATKYGRAYAYAELEARQDSRLVGLDKIRSAIAHEAALLATGFPARPFILPRRAGAAREEMQFIAEEVLARAIEKAREKVA